MYNIPEKATVINIVVASGSKEHLLSVGVRLPEGDTVLLGHVAALGQHLGVRDRLLPCTPS